jgi:hypothetical protein
VITFDAACNNIVPCLGPAFNDGNHVVERQVLGGALFPAVLAGVVIARIDVCPAEFNVLKLFSNFYIFQKTEHARHFDCEADAADFPVIFGQNFDFSLIEQAQSPFPGYNVDRLIRCIQDQCVFHLPALVKRSPGNIDPARQNGHYGNCVRYTKTMAKARTKS